MAILYAMSDIHGELEIFQRALSRIDLDSPGNKLFLLGDYIDGGPASGQVLRLIYDLQRRYGSDRVIALRGNHEMALLEWLDIYRRTPRPGLPDWSPWLREDEARGFQTLRTLLPPEDWVRFTRLAPDLSADQRNREAVRLVRAAHLDLIRWLKGLPFFCQTETQIFVHAGIDELAGDWWPWGTPNSVFTGKYPASTGPFYKDIIAGHIGADRLTGDRNFHRVCWDGESHYYIDGSTAESGCLPILKYDTERKRYTEFINEIEEEIQHVRMHP